MGPQDKVRQCAKCEQLKPDSEFHKCKTGREGLSHWCKICSNANSKKWRERNPERHSKLVKDWYHSDLAKRRNQRLMLKFGITQADYDRMLESQDGKCLICGANRPGDRDNFSVDHCHLTGIVRGLLCTKCNRGLGCFNDLPGLLRKAADYLEHFQKGIDMQNTTSYNKPQDASTPAVQAEAPILGGKCDSGPAGMGGVSMSGADSNQAGSGFGGKADSIGGKGNVPGCCVGMDGKMPTAGGKADNCAGMADKKTPAPEIAQGGAAQVYDGQAGWKAAN